MNKSVFFLATLFMILGINNASSAFTRASFRTKKAESVIAVKDSYSAPKISILVKMPYLVETEDTEITPILNSSMIADCLGKAYQDMELEKALNSYIDDSGVKFTNRLEKTRQESPKAFDGKTFDLTSVMKVNDVLHQVLTTQQTIEEFNETTEEPVRFTRYFNYNLNTGFPLRLKEIFEDSSELQVLEMMHRQCVELYRYTPGATSIESPKHLTENIEITKDGIRFLYDAKAISSKYEKPFEMFLSYEELSTVLRDSFTRMLEPQKKVQIKVNRAYDSNRRF